MDHEFSYAQKVTLAVIPKISGVLSMCGASWIIVEVLTDQTKRKTVYNRLLLYMSIMDAAVAVTYVLSTWPIPTDTPTGKWIFPKLILNFPWHQNEGHRLTGSFGVVVVVLDFLL
jgi:hypothetical protein